MAEEQNGPAREAEPLDDIYRASLDCVHCGLCLTSCPTYLATGRETSSPRGRVYLMRGVAEGRAALSGLLAEEAHLCLGCRACETACPSGVQYGAMLEDTRAAIARAEVRRGFGPKLERFVLRYVVAVQRRLRAVLLVLGFMQRFGIDRVGAAVLPARLRAAHALAPVVPKASERRALPSVTPARGEQRGRVAFFTGCLMSEVFAPVQQATVRLLAANGYEVIVPERQGCCGALQAHAGDFAFAQELARHNVSAFGPCLQTDGSGVDAIIVDSAGCGASMREAGRWLPDEGEPFAGRVRDVCEFLDEVGLRTSHKTPRTRVCYDDPCHLVHGQRVEAAPRRLLAQVEGVELVAHADAARCCGAAGTYNLTQPEMSQVVLGEKMDSLAKANPEVIATGNPGCMMQIASGVRARGLAAEVVHPVELLARSLCDGV